MVWGDVDFDKNTLTVTGGEAGTKNHEFRHFFATTCIEAGVDIPTVARWLGHKDGGVLAMRVYGHLRQEHSFRQIKLVNFGLESSPTEAATKLGSSAPTVRPDSQPTGCAVHRD